eukprot:2592374-Alexandrium_andersonii.AAC.1
MSASLVGSEMCIRDSLSFPASSLDASDASGLWASPVRFRHPGDRPPFIVVASAAHSPGSSL